MECSWISPAELPGTTRLYSTFLSDFPRVCDFYGHPPNANGIDEAAREIRLEDSIRRAVVEVLNELFITASRADLSAAPAATANASTSRHTFVQVLYAAKGLGPAKNRSMIAQAISAQIT